jgi:phosphoribosylglycinamide formyltransferase-1
MTPVSEVVYEAPMPWFPAPARLAILLSGRGSNFEALADACDAGKLPARIASVISDNPEAVGLARAEERGLRAKALPRGAFPDHAAHERAIENELTDAAADVLCLAGFMRLLSPDFCEHFPLRMLNIHPSLLPSFPGLHAQRQALEWGARVTGATVHFVDAGLDSGPIVDQVAVEVKAGDDEERLSSRILAEEHRLYPRALARLLRGGWRLVGKRVEFGV